MVVLHKMFPIFSDPNFYQNSVDLFAENLQQLKDSKFLKNDSYVKNFDEKKIKQKTDFNVTDLITSKSTVITLEYLKTDMISNYFSPSDLLEYVQGEFKVKITNGFIQNFNFSSNASNSVAWIKAIQFANDNYSNNVIYQLNNNGLINIKVVRDILPSEQLKAWFSQELIMMIGLPFLIPINIQGKNCYKCHKCGKSYEYPNPLKIHLATICDQNPIDVVWLKLQHIVITTKKKEQQKLYDHREEFDSLGIWNKHYQIPLPHRGPSLFLRPNEQCTSTESFNYPFFQYYGHASAFTSTSKNTRHQSPLSLQSDSHKLVPKNKLERHHYNLEHHSIVSTSTSIASTSEEAMSAAAQIETIVSNIGASKQGHLCIYCGKLYSRKYGLKIHIRTHTGFKPLKCKFCLRPFGDPSNLNKHIRLHLQTGNLNHRCHLCHKTLPRRRDLQKHIEAKHCMIVQDQAESIM